MKAVIPAAGLGTRFLPYTKTQPKEMLPVVDKPAIQYVVEEAVESGLNDILIITGRGKRAIEDYFDRSVELEDYLRKFSKEKELKLMMSVGELANVMYVRQKEPLGLGHAISCAKQYVGEEPFAALLGDDICMDKAPCTKQLIDIFKEKNAMILAVQEVPKDKISAYGIVTGKQVNEDLYKVEDIVEKPSPDSIKSNLATIGRYIFLPTIFEKLKSTGPGVGGEVQLTDAIRKTLDSEDIFALRFKGKRYDIGDRVSWLMANIELSLHQPGFKESLNHILRDDAFR